MSNFLILSILIFLALLSYFAPTIIAYRKKKAELPFIFIINLVFGWTLFVYIWILLVSLNDEER